MTLGTTDTGWWGYRYHLSVHLKLPPNEKVASKTEQNKTKPHLGEVQV